MTVPDDAGSLLQETSRMFVLPMHKAPPGLQEL